LRHHDMRVFDMELPLCDCCHANCEAPCRLSDTADTTCLSRPLPKHPSPPSWNVLLPDSAGRLLA
jgi:hypothetical protein